MHRICRRRLPRQARQVHVQRARDRGRNQYSIISDLPELGKPLLPRNYPAVLVFNIDTIILPAKQLILSELVKMYTTPEHPDPAPMVASNQYFERPEQVQLCYRACCEGDLDSVKEQVRQLLHNPEAAPVGQEPSPKWLYSSLCEAILRNDVSIVKFMLDEGVAGKRLPGEEAVRSQAYEVLELLLLQYGWDINESMGRNRTSVLGYCFRFSVTPQLQHLLTNL